MAVGRMVAEVLEEDVPQLLDRDSVGYAVGRAGSGHVADAGVAVGDVGYIPATMSLPMPFSWLPSKMRGASDCRFSMTMSNIAGAVVAVSPKIAATPTARQILLIIDSLRTGR